MQNLLPFQWKESLEHLHDKTGRLLDKLTRSKKNVDSKEHITEDLLPSFTKLGGPVLDMHESAGELVLTLEMPGMKKEDFSIDLAGKRLMLHGQKKDTREQKTTGRSYLSECRYGRFARTVQLPYEVNDQTVKADLMDGILTIQMNKPTEENYRIYRVPIT